MNEDSMDFLFEQAISDMQANMNDLASTQSHDLFRRNSTTEHNPVDVKAVVDTFNECQRFGQQCQLYATEIFHFKDPSAVKRDFLCIKCERFFRLNLKYETDKCLLCMDHHMDLGHYIGHKVEMLYCDICDKGYRNLEQFYKHLSPIHSFIFYNCFCCDELFQLKYSLVWHMIFEHRLNKMETIRTNFEYKCVQCKQTFRNIKDVQSHINAVGNHFQIACEKDKINCVMCKKPIEEEQQSA